MAWDKTLPANSTKIRNYPTVLTANFASVEEGDDTLQIWKINLIERDVIPSAPSATPSRIDDTMQLYSRDDGSTSQFYILDAENPANEIQMTRTTEVSDASDGQTFLPGGLLLQWGVDSVSASSGSKTITFHTAFPSTVYNVVATASYSGNTSDSLGYLRGSITTSNFTWYNSTAVGYNVYWMAIGK